MFVEQIHIFKFVIVGGLVVDIYTGGQGLTQHPCQPPSYQSRLFDVFDGGGKVCDMMKRRPHDKYDTQLYLPMKKQFLS